MKQYTNYLYFICTVAVFGGIMFGFDIAIVSVAVPFIQEYFHWNELELGWGVSTLLIGCIIGSFCTGYVTDKYGRRKVLIAISLIFGVSCLGTAIASTSDTFIIFRFIGGLSVGAVSVLSPMYVAEIAPSAIRGRLTAIYQLCIMLGILISYATNYALKDLVDNWRWMFASGVIPSVVFFIGLLYIPESPRWLYINNKKEQAFAVLSRIFDESTAKNILIDIQGSQSAKVTVNGNIFSELFHKRFRKSIIIGFTLAVLVQLIGCNAALDYAPKIMMAAGFSINDALFFNIFMGVVNLIATIFGVVMIDKIGRKPLYLYGSLIMGISLLFLGYSFHHAMLPSLVLVLLFSYIACFSACIGPVFWTLVSEMFPNKIRGMAVAFVSFVQWIFNFLVVWLFPHFLSSLGGANTFYFFATMCIIQLVVTKIWLPETKGKTLEQIEMLWE